MIDISNALNIEGWMSEAELTWLAQTAAKCINAIEIGSWRGRSTRAIGDHIRGTLIAVDHWLGDDEETKALEDKYITWKTPLTTRIDYETLGGDEIYKIFHHNLKDLIVSCRVIPIRASSREAAQLLKGQQVDFVFIDGSHTESGCGADIDLYLPLVRPGGIISGHDYDHVPWHAGVRKAVNDRFREVHTVDTIWWTTATG